MTIGFGDRLPAATVLEMTEDGPKPVDLAERLKGRRVVIFGLPGAFTGICSTSHVPSFIRTRQGFADKGVDEVICLAVNDPFVMNAWGEATGATAAGIVMLADASGAFAKGIGMLFSIPERGLIDRSRRYALLAEDGVVKVWHPEPDRGCSISGGEALLEAI
ncbi:MAG: peroxiredoxin [Rhodobacteraceae bacterium]|uniref:peroxiredoxin n=1 Tax=Albidovulum sp. TaxID=1872424 RepID=UPI001DE26A65|nr:peroxiredoxin [Paracoccaceae bacterium]HPE24097.1 peroxiredoxin [Albidovulum sp.]MCB2118749.1 peroxiredoxin [Paracoccaceae bacterium]MCB2123147.1 peroxiredoxin [Paracoccaceae bacterium]MCB2132074.1 peroxiredoxin [Paracoccaceae bacterium]